MPACITPHGLFTLDVATLLPKACMQTEPAAWSWWWWWESTHARTKKPPDSGEIDSVILAVAVLRPGPVPAEHVNVCVAS